MREATIKTIDGDLDRVAALTVEEFPFFQIPERSRRSNNKQITYLQTFATFDIETTTIQPDPDKAPEGFMYHWQMNIGGVNVYGRRWEEWLDLMREISEWCNLSPERRMVVYVHNLGYEFQFIKDFLIEDLGGMEVFALASRVPVHVSCGAGFEFRCSYKLTNMNLNRATINELGVVHPKAAGDLDYKKMRTAVTPLDDTEFGYCLADVVSLYELIENRLKNEEDTINTIPLTSTGYIRRDTRLACRADRHYRDRVFKKQRMDKDVYILLKEAGRGGNTHANRFMSGVIWPGVDSLDAASMYPAMQVLSDRFPADKFSYYGDIDNMKEFEELTNKYCCLFRVILQDVKIKPHVTIPYIPSAKVLSKGGGCKYDNGRVLKADWILITVTEIDWEIIASQYDFSGASVSDMHIARRGYLPQPIIDTIMKYFKQKTELKAAIRHEKDPEKLKNLIYLYNKSKNRLNAIFGMCYTDPVRRTITVNDRGEWGETVPDIDEALEKFYKSRNSFLVYAWGVVTTALARLHLQRILDITGEDTLYCDTDSDKAIISPETMEKINQLNKEIIAKCEERKAYADADGDRYYMGVFELETKKEKYAKFCTLGAKKYAYEDSEGFHITISGVNKEIGAREMGSIENFKPGFIFKEAGGKTLYYNDSEKHYIEVDGCRMLTASNVGMIDSTYELGLTNEYAELIGLNVYKELQ